MSQDRNLQPTSDHAALLTNLDGFRSILPDVLRDLENAHERCEALRVRLDSMEKTLYHRLDALCLTVNKLSQEVKANSPPVRSQRRRETEEIVKEIVGDSTFPTLVRRLNALEARMTSGESRDSSFAQDLSRLRQDLASLSNSGDVAKRNRQEILDRLDRLEAKFTSSTYDSPSPSVDESPSPVVEKPLSERRRGDADFVVAGERYLTGEHDVVGPMSPSTREGLPDQLQGPFNGDADNPYYFLPNGNYYPDTHPFAADPNRLKWNHVIRRLEGYREDHPRDPQFAPGALKGASYARSLDGKTFRLTGEYRVPQAGEYYLSGGVAYRKSRWNMSEYGFRKPAVLDVDEHAPTGGPRLIAVEYPVRSSSSSSSS